VQFAGWPVDTLNKIQYKNNKLKLPGVPFGGSTPNLPKYFGLVILKRRYADFYPIALNSPDMVQNL